MNGRSVEPSAFDAGPAGSLVPGSMPPSLGRAQRLLLVEDHADSAEMTSMMLRLEGWQVTVASTAAQARELAAAGTYDAVIGDVGLPDGCGLELLAALRAAQARVGNGSLVAIALSGYGQAADRERALAAGYAAHLLKPVQAEQLVKLLRRLLAAQAGG